MLAIWPVRHAAVVDERDVARIRAETKARRTFYTPEELISEHPFPEGSRPELIEDKPVNPQLQAQLETEPLATLVADARASGNPVRGAKLFFNEKVACATCHAVPYGYQLGPQLTDKRPDADRAYLVESILKPSAKIRQGYQSVNVLTAEGQLLSGFLVSQTDKQVVLSLPTDKGKKRVLAADEVDEVIEQPASTMPLGLIGQLKDRAAFLDLVRFVFAVNDGGRAELNRLKKKAGVRN